MSNYKMNNLYIKLVTSINVFCFSDKKARTSSIEECTKHQACLLDKIYKLIYRPQVLQVSYLNQS